MQSARKRTDGGGLAVGRARGDGYAYLCPVGDSTFLFLQFWTGSGSASMDLSGNDAESGLLADGFYHDQQGGNEVVFCLRIALQPHLCGIGTDGNFNVWIGGDRNGLFWP